MKGRLGHNVKAIGGLLLNPDLWISIDSYFFIELVISKWTSCLSSNSKVAPR